MDDIIIYVKLCLSCPLGYDNDIDSFKKYESCPYFLIPLCVMIGVLKLIFNEGISANFSVL